MPMNRIMALVVLACTGSSSFAQKVRVDFDHGADFYHYKTYRWVNVPEVRPAEAQFPNQLMQERIVGLVEEALTAKHFRRVETGGDLLLDYQMNVTEQPQFMTYTDGAGPGWAWGWNNAISTTTTQIILIGNLSINMIDAHRKQLVFQGVWTDTISSKPWKNTKKLAKGINKIFEKYPPKL